MRVTKHLTLALALVTLAAASARGQEEAVNVYQTLHPSVVGLQNLEGNGTGIILDQSGLILTNAHVIASPLPYKCKVDILRGEKTETVVFRQVKILKVHPKLDLALVQIDASEHQGELRPAKILTQKAIPGQRVYAIGNPGAGGQVLTKTITQGIVSGVDRELDDVKYYQVDAAINPGNSGGPLCDKTGAVLGVVTLKSTDVENVGFAIPLYNLNKDEFVPPKNRKGDPTKAAQLLAEASKYYKIAKQIQEQRGVEDKQAKLYSAYSAYHYHLALSQDPTNDSIYYNFGMLMRTFGRHDVATAYLLEAVDLNSWGASEYYRELGFALFKQQKLDEAVAVWQEGIAKFPLAGVRIWDDLAVYWKSKPDHYESAYSASVALHLVEQANQGSPRAGVMKALIAEMRTKLDDAQKQKLDAAVAGIAGGLKQRKATADQQRAAQKKQLTPQFAQFVRNNGSLEHEDAPEVAVTQDPPPVKPAVDPEPAPADPNADEKAAAATLQTAKSWQAKGNDRLANTWLRRVVERYPKTQAAREARQLLGIAQPTPLPRTWTSSNGKYRIEATLMSSQGNSVRLKKKDGTILTLSLDQLSAADRQYVRSQSGR